MPERTGRFEWVEKLARIALVATLAVVGLSVAGTIFWIVQVARLTPSIPALVSPGLTLLGQLVAGVWIFIAYGLVRLLVRTEVSAANNVARIARLESILNDQDKSIHKLVDLASLSNEAKRLLFRDHELELMREQIHADLVRKDYETAKTFIERLETNFGYADEAARLREEVEHYRQASEEEKTEGAIQRIQQVIDRRDWDRALRETERLRRVYPNSQRVAELPARIEEARAAHKSELLKTYGQAVKKNDIDGGIELLRELDRYLTPQEAAALSESARDVFRKKLHNLGVQFAIFVNDQQWADAVATGEEIIREYPNSRMAEEAREKMDRLRALAAGAQRAAAPGQSS